MKKFFSLLLILMAFSVNAQSDSLAVKSPKIVCKIKYGKTVGFGDYTIKFAEVISDSRCPKKVTCVWAGEAKVRLEIQKNTEPVENKNVLFDIQGKSTPLFDMENISVKTYRLEPYPEKLPIQDKTEYVLNLILVGKDS